MEKHKIKFWNLSWLRLNFYNLLLGLLIGLILTLLISAFKGEWIGVRSATFQFLYSVVISLSITNTIYVMQKLLRFERRNAWLYLIVYYMAALIGMVIAIELIYLIQSWLFNVPYHFFHMEDMRFSSIVVIVVCTIVYAYYWQKKLMDVKLQEKNLDLLRLKQMKTQAELATLQSKINPHFLYNSLNAIASLIHEDPEAAESMTLKLSKLFRYSINQNQEDLVQVREEIEIVSTYLDIEKVRFGNRIIFAIDVDETLLEAKIPRFLIQPLVENALKHGLKDVTADGELIIRIRKADGIEIIVADNGSPFPDDMETGYGLQSTYDKLGLLYNDRYEVQISNHPEKQIKIKIPFTNG